MRPDNLLIFILAALIVIMSALVVHRSHQTTTSMNGTELPAFHLPTLDNSSQEISEQTLRGQVFLLTIWAPWCSACAAENVTLLLIAKQYHVPILGIAYKDTPENAKNWLNHFGNPFTVTAIDINGSLQQRFQLYGIPQTFIVDKKGLIRLEFMGAIDWDFWQKTLWPQLQEYQKELDER